MKLKTRELVLAAMLSALLIAAKQAMSFIPNFEPVTLLLILYTLHFPRMTPLIIYVFVAVQVLLYGFNVSLHMDHSLRCSAPAGPVGQLPFVDYRRHGVRDALWPALFTGLSFHWRLEHGTFVVHFRHPI